MIFPKSCVPRKCKEFQNQTEISVIKREELDALAHPAQYSIKQIIYQIASFVLFLGPIRLIINFFVLLFVISILLIYKFVLKTFQISAKMGRDFCLGLARFGIRVTLFGFGVVYIKTEGRFDNQSRFIVSNHVSFLDYFIVLLFHDYVSVVDESLRYIPLVPDIIESVNPLYVDFGKKKRYEKMVFDRADDFHSPPILIFPEGLPCGQGSSLMKFEDTPFLTPYKVQPLTVRYHMSCTPEGWNSYQYQGESLWIYFFRLLAMPPSVLSIHFLPVMSAENDAKSDVSMFPKVAQISVANFIGIRAVSKSRKIEAKRYD